MRHNLLLWFALVASTAVALVPGRVRVASADNTVDCSGLKKIDFDHRYKKGDRIWSSFGYTGSGHPLSCILDECLHKNDYDQSAWKSQGDCSARPAGL
jgi:hypothetical protein